MEKLFQLKFPTTRDHLKRVESELKSFLAAWKVDELDALGVHLAFHEHCMNIIEHGSAAAGNSISEIVASVDVSAHVGFVHTILTIVDTTPPFDPMSAEGDGLGICMIKAISGSISWESRDGENICTFVFPKLRMN